MEEGSPLFLNEPIQRATRAAQAMLLIEELTDAEIEEAGRSAELFAGYAGGHAAIGCVFVADSRIRVVGCAGEGG